LLFTFTALQIFANEFVVKSFEIISNDLSARRYERIDVNDIPCAIIKIRTDLLKPFFFEANLGIEGDVEYKENNEIWLYVSEGERHLTIAKNNFITLSYSIPEHVEKSSVYRLNLSAKDNSITVMIISEPSDAEKWLDGEMLGNGETYIIESGKYELSVKKKGYKSFSGGITVDEKNALFRNITLAETEPQKITITSMPSGANILIDEVNEGRTNKQLFKFPGKYHLRIILDAHAPIQDTISVTDTGENNWSYSLQKTTGTLTVITTPLEAELLVNNEVKASKQIDLAPGNYRLGVLHDDFESQYRNIVISQGVSITETFRLQQLYGKLQFTVEPMETKVVLYQDKIEKYSWEGSLFMDNIPMGLYTAELSCLGYKTKRVALRIKEDEQYNLDLNLEPAPISGSKSQAGYDEEGIIPFFDKAPEAIGGYEAIIRAAREQYPPFALKAGVEGTVIVQAIVDAEGWVRSAKVIKDIPNSDLGEAAVLAVKSVRWKPAMYENNPVKVQVSITVPFKLR